MTYENILKTFDCGHLTFVFVTLILYEICCYTVYRITIKLLVVKFISIIILIKFKKQNE